MIYQVMPDLSESEYAELKADIELRGVMVAVEYDEHDNVLDGHHRIRACKELGIEDWPKVRRLGLSDDAKRLHAFALNAKRRQLTASQRAILALDILPLLEAEAARRMASTQFGSTATETFQEPGSAAAKAAKIVGANERYIYTAKQIQKSDPERIERIRRGEDSLGKKARGETIDRIRPMAEAGNSARQIAEEIGISTERVTYLANLHDVKLPLARTVQRVDVIRVIEETVTALSGLAIGIDSIRGKIQEIDRKQAGEWREALVQPIKTINWLLKQLKGN
jgi:hypothetical protein